MYHFIRVMGTVTSMSWVFCLRKSKWHSAGTSVGLGGPCSPSLGVRGSGSPMGVLSRPGLQTFSETANVCLHNAPHVFAVVNIVVKSDK